MKMLKEPAGHKGEIANLRTLSSKTFDMGKGRRICACLAGLAHVPSDLARFDSKGSFSWADPDITITLVKGIYQVRGGWFKANVDVANISVQYISRSGTKLRMRLDKIGGNKAIVPSSITVENNYITWHDVAPDIDIQLQFRPERMEWFKRMKSATAARQFDWTIQEDNDNLDKFDGNSTGNDNEYQTDTPNQRTFKATTSFKFIKNVNGITTTRFREIWDGSITQLDPVTHVKSKVFNPIYPVSLDASVSINISDTLDDGHQGGYGYWKHTGNAYNYIVVSYNYPTGYRPAHRFTSVGVPKDATINTATLDLQKQRNYSANLSVDFYGEDVDNASQWTANQSGGMVSGITKTTAKTTESGTQWGYTGLLQVDIKSIVEEITTRAGWVSGNAMRIACPNAIGGVSGAQNWHDLSKSGSPVVAQLNIDYTVGGVTKTVNETGSGSDSLNMSASQSISETGNGDDSFTPSASVSASDAGSGSDALLLNSLHAITESGLGSESLSISPLITVVDNGLGSEGLTLAISVSISDSGTGQDNLNLLTGILKSVAESGQGSDVISQISAQYSIPENGQGIDQAVLSVLLSLSESANGLDSVSTTSQIIKTVLEMATGSDSVSATVSVSVTEVGNAAEILLVNALLALVETGSGIETVNNFDSTSRITTITFSLSRRSMTFDLKKRSIEFTLN